MSAMERIQDTRIWMHHFPPYFLKKSEIQSSYLSKHLIASVSSREELALLSANV